MTEFKHIDITKWSSLADLYDRSVNLSYMLERITHERGIIIEEICSIMDEREYDLISFSGNEFIFKLRSESE